MQFSIISNSHMKQGVAMTNSWRENTNEQAKGEDVRR